MQSLNFDTIIYPANLTGLVAASIFKSEGQKVLLLNRYGFFGGTITESLNLFQKKIDDSSNGQITHKILDRINEYKDGVLYEGQNHLIFNPEVIKYVLQKFAEENQIALLFHINPYKIEFKDGLINLSVIGREGTINLSCKKLFDFSTEFTFAPLFEKFSRTFKTGFVNFISLPVDDEDVFQNVYLKKKLKDNRWWISIKNESDNVSEVERFAQIAFDIIDEKLRAKKSRIQIVPAQSNLIFEFMKSEKDIEGVYFITNFINSFSHDEELLIAKQIERSLTDVRNF